MKIDSTNALNQYQALKIQSLESSLSGKAKSTLHHQANALKDNPTQKSQNTQSKEDATLKEQTDAFEAILLKFMLDNALKLEYPLFPKQPGTDIYHSMYKESLSEQLSGSFGYSKALYDWLKEQGKA
ncbi:hypothetical protein [Helicobacter sp. MIT 01-3238]|uniref:hypothetical protein n=1 Tax=Helicobacter sp. MIT 01-3238 TaxID=398627 RepID=UPI000E1F314E|nr:hypothetical protein [Helicobacter sp. MIT 01-3238]RDU52324.1 hypothetical protein CQA40_07620 [Helicobacter sp. MIT 01-3238]